MRVEPVSSQHWQRRGPHQGPNSNDYEHQKQHPLHRKTPKKSPLVGELIRPSPHGEDGGQLWITGSVSPHLFDVSNRRNGVATVTRVASNGCL